eukprot:TRINITY_DN80733_c0_g1_i1.p1 TRINITY_DN80733_c0_g1~~TRINITY_DN80733_c0_g1_i1.p1  ORF type:complete len:695 (+),score=264.47 TRINITY_DN80733_c0_g1_i1:124-2208(+)
MFARCGLTAALLALPASGADISLSSDAARPTTKVKKLLQDMAKDLEKEGEEDDKQYDKMSCWCRDNEEAKTRAIADAQVSVKSLESRIEELQASTIRLTTQITALEEEIKKNTDSLAESANLREKQKDKFHKDEKDTLQTLTSVKNAETTITSKRSASLLQTDKQHLATATDGLREVIAKHGRHLTKLEKSRLEAWINNPVTKQTAFLQSGKQPAEGSVDTIVGVLGGLKDDFTNNLENLRSDEEKSLTSFNNLEEAKTTEINAGKAQAEKKKEEKANDDEEKAIKKQTVKDTNRAIAADEKFLVEMKAKCAKADEMYEERKKIRVEETAAVGKAIEILGSDAANDNFAKTLGPAKAGFLQISSESKITKDAADSLIHAGQRLRNQQLITLGLSAKLDGFKRVKEAIDEMTEALKKQQADEVKHRDYCVAEFQQNELATQDNTRSKQNAKAQLAALQLSKKAAEDAIKVAEAAIAEMQKQLKKAEENRENENTEFQQVVADQRVTQKLLKEALVVLRDFYAKPVEDKAALVQVRNHKQAPGEAKGESPEDFKGYRENKRGSGVMLMLQQILQDTAHMEKEAHTAEANAQETYESFVKSTSESVGAQEKEIEGKMEEKAGIERDIVNTEDELKGREETLAELGDAKSALHEECDFTLRNFEVTQSARQGELDALQQAKSMLNGARELPKELQEEA